MASSLTVAKLIDRARSRSPHFATMPNAPEGALVGAIEDRQRSLLLLHGNTVEGLVTTSAQIATVFSGVLVGSSNGVPVYTTTFADGYVTHSDAGVPYWDFTETPIAGDPFGQNGGTPGFPLPDDFVKLVKATVVYSDNRIGPLEIIEEPMRLARQRQSPPVAFVNGNRLVPVRPLTTGNSGDPWSQSIIAIQLSYVAAPVLASLSDSITLPIVLMEALLAGLCETMAAFSTTMPAGDRARFSELAREAERAAQMYSDDIIGTASSTTVRYR
jgi:hypothetical protein